MKYFKNQTTKFISYSNWYIRPNYIIKLSNNFYQIHKISTLNLQQFHIVTTNYSKHIYISYLTENVADTVEKKKKNCIFKNWMETSKTFQLGLIYFL